MNYNGIKAPINNSGSLSSGISEQRTGFDDNDTLTFVQPSEKCLCKTCRYRYPDPYGYRNGNCYKYKKESGKPNGILFDGDKCIYYRKDRSN